MPSSAMAELYRICRSSTGSSSAGSTVSAKRTMSSTFRQDLSVNRSSADAETGRSSRISSFLALYTRFVWLLAIRTQALFSPAQPERRMSRMHGVSAQQTSTGVLRRYSRISSVRSSDTSAITCNPRPAAPAAIPAAMADSMPFSPPVFGTTALFTFFRMFPLTSARTRSGRQPRSSRSSAAA